MYLNRPKSVRVIHGFIPLIIMVLIFGVYLSQSLQGMKVSETTAFGIVLGGQGSPIPISTIETGDIWAGGLTGTIVVNQNTNRIYLGDFFSGNVTVIDSQLHSLVTRIVLPGLVGNGIAIDPDTDTIYVPVVGCLSPQNMSNACSKIVEIDGSTNNIVGELPLQMGLQDLVFDSATHILYGVVYSETSCCLIGIDVQTNSIVANVSLNLEVCTSCVAIDELTNTVYVAGCNPAFGLVCGSEALIINGTSETLQNNITIGSDLYPSIAVDERTDTLYVTNHTYLVALNGTTGAIIYDSGIASCSAVGSLSIDQSTNQVLATASGYVLAFNESNGTLSNMYSPSSSPQYVAFNPETREIYATLSSGYFLSFHNVINQGHLNASLIGPSVNCPLP